MSFTRNLMNILIPHRQQIVLFTSINEGFHPRADEDSIEISFMARVGLYVAVLGTLIIVVSLTLKYLCNSSSDDNVQRAEGETTESLVVVPEEPEKIIGLPYGETDDNNKATGDNVCVICYDILRNCFFVPCGHCATCHDCAMRIMEGENKICPICRRFIYKVKGLPIP